MGVAFWRRERTSILTRRAAAAAKTSNCGDLTRPSTMTLPGAMAWTAGAPAASAALASTSGAVSEISTNKFGHVLRRLATVGYNRSDRFADEPHHVVGKDRLANRQIIEFVQHRRDRPQRRKVGGGTTSAPSGAKMRVMTPAATELRTKRTQCAAARSAVKRPCPVTSAGSSSAPDRASDPFSPREPLVCARSFDWSAPARGAPRRAPGRAGSRRWSGDPPADRRRRRQLRRRRGTRRRPAPGR